MAIIIFRSLVIVRRMNKVKRRITIKAVNEDKYIIKFQSLMLFY